MPAIDALLKNNDAYASSFDKGDLPLPPAKKVAVVSGMDAPRPRPGARPRGGRSPRDPQRRRRRHRRRHPQPGHQPAPAGHRGGHPDPPHRLRDVTFEDDEFEQQILEDTGMKPGWAAESFSDLDAGLNQSVQRIRSSPFMPRTDNVRGLVYEVESGRLREVR